MSRTATTAANSGDAIALPSAGLWWIGWNIDAAGNPAAYGALFSTVTTGTNVNPYGTEVIPATIYETSPAGIRQAAKGLWLVETTGPETVYLRIYTFNGSGTLVNGGSWTAQKIDVEGTGGGSTSTPTLDLDAGTEVFFTPPAGATVQSCNWMKVGKIVTFQARINGLSLSAASLVMPITKWTPTGRSDFGVRITVTTSGTPSELGLRGVVNSAGLTIVTNSAVGATEISMVGVFEVTP